MNKLDLTGQRFEKLTVLQDAGRDNHKQVMWLCRCNCGNEHIARASHLVLGKIRSCGCLAREIARGQSWNLRHGMARVRQGPVYRAWTRMRNWCSDLNNPHYGGKGISCEWDTFEEFFQDIGKDYPGAGHRLKRANCEDDFRSDNVFWQKIGTGVKGVNYHKKARKFVARIRIDGKVRQLGEFKTMDEAVATRQRYGVV